MSIESADILTVTDDETAGLIAEHLAARIEGKIVVEIGGGIGLLALHLSAIAKHVYCIEANPVWASFFEVYFAENKPSNVDYLFGLADRFAGTISADVAIFCTHSGVASMRLAASLFAPVVIDVYGDIIADSPGSFDRLATTLRAMS